jgi:tetratricopeptide (TPR) repeat protein
MINHKPLRSTGTLAKTLCALSLTMACVPAWSEAEGTRAEQPRFEMAVFSDSAHGAKILSGNYDKAITKIHTGSRSADELHVQTNLCVAYAKSGDMEAAETACEEAVVLAKSVRKNNTSSFSGETAAQRHARYLAIALSNRGVLRAVMGDREGAKKDFDAAMAQHPHVSSVKANLERIGVKSEGETA